MSVADYGESISWDAENFVFHPNHKLLSKIDKSKQRTMLDNEVFYDEDTIRHISRSLINALNYLHTNLNIVHRDIKP